MNTSYYLISHLASVAENDRGPNVVGGMVTFFAKKLGLDEKLDALDEVEGNHRIDLDLCVNMRMINAANVQSRRKFYQLINMERSILLPNPARTDTDLKQTGFTHLLLGEPRGRTGSTES